MPTYDYRCEECGHVFEIFHGMSETPEVECPRCGGDPVRVISGGSGIIFKGSGFYANDYGRSGGTSCGLDSPCCGRDKPCDNPPCSD